MANFHTLARQNTTLDVAYSDDSQALGKQYLQVMQKP